MKQALDKEQREMAKKGQYMSMADLEKWIVNYPNSRHYDQAELDRAIWGRTVDGEQVGGVLSRARAVFGIGCAPLSSVT